MKTFKTSKGTELPLLNLKGKDYLQVAHRLVWLREDHPDYSIRTEFILLEEGYAIAKATIAHPSGYILATAHKREDAKHFPDHLEKAETGAIGRALALIGYGTQFTSDLDEGDRIVDAPLGHGSPISNVTPHLVSNFKQSNEIYRMDFGTRWKGMTLEEIYNSEIGGQRAMEDFIIYLEKSSTPEKPMGDKAKKFIVETVAFLASKEKIFDSPIDDLPF